MSDIVNECPKCHRVAVYDGECDICGTFVCQRCGTELHIDTEGYAECSKCKKGRFKVIGESL